MIPRGFSFSAVNAGVKSPENKKLDMGLVYCSRDATAAAVFTTNRVKAAPVIVGMELLPSQSIRAVIANSGNANACTGASGIEDARAIMRAVAGELKISEDQVVPMSTGVIGMRLPIERMLDKVPALANGLGDDFESFNRSIMTTDTFEKIVQKQASKARILGIAKGAGMIAPDMATTLAIVLTDAKVPFQELGKSMKDIVKTSFNAITVDGDTSTNDTLLVLSSGMVEVNWSELESVLREAVQDLALMVVKDGEGATKLIRIRVGGAKNDAEAKTIAMSVANSLLVKTAFYGADPNWGRIMTAIGYSGIEIDPETVLMSIAGIETVRGGQISPHYDEHKLHQALQEKEIKIEISVGQDPGSFLALTTDLSKAYVEINADYRT
ncbi:MAG: bifunctional glutamate N-acetyltransferase/amino-acid acetyltransferase ArgJ [Deltaproteobacteria bacterium]|nr:bifunctional glutamate N-acetyltransferase/amino-acid acetyltransferase ArgJ [Deltaproteobacteria bacterium]